MTERALKAGWRWVKFGDVVKLNKERCKNPTAEGIKRYVGLEHITPEDLQIRRWGLVAEGTTFTNYFQPGQVLFGKRRAYQRKVAVADFEGVCSSDIYVFEPKNNRLLPELLPFICQTEGFFNHAVRTSAGSLSPRTNWKQLAKYEFALPPLEEQGHLVKLLRTSTQVVEAYYLALNKAQKVVEATREYLFSHERTSRTTLGKVLRAIKAGKSLVGINEPPSSGEYAVLKVSAVGLNGFVPQESKTLVEQAQFLPEYSIKSGDLIITRANTPDLVGMVCFVQQDYPNLMLCDKTLRLVPSQEIAPKLLWEALCTRHVRQQIKSVATGTGAAMKNISQAKLRQLKIQLPSDSGSNSQILKQISTARQSLAFLQGRLRAAQSLYSSLNKALLTGFQAEVLPSWARRAV